MLDTVFGLPTHPLIVHAVVVLLPLAALGGVAVALVPALRRRYGVLVALLTLAGVGSVKLAESSGSHLYDRLSDRFGPADATEAGLMQRHADLAHKLMPWAILLLVGVALVVLPPLLVRRRAAVAAREPVPAGVGGRAGPAAGPDRGPAWKLPVALLGVAVTLVGAAATLILVTRIGHLGSEAAWNRLDRPAAVAGTGIELG